MDNRISSRSIVAVGKEQVSSDLDGEAVILGLKSGVYYGLDAVGARIWNLIQQPSAVSDILDRLLREYEVEPDRFERDLLSLLQELATEGLIKIKNETSL